MTPEHSHVIRYTEARYIDAWTALCACGSGWGSSTPEDEIPPEVWEQVEQARARGRPDATSD